MREGGGGPLTPPQVPAVVGMLPGRSMLMLTFSRPKPKVQQTVSQPRVVGISSAEWQGRVSLVNSDEVVRGH